MKDCYLPQKKDHWLAGPYHGWNAGKAVLTQCGGSYASWASYGTELGVVRLKANVILETNDGGEIYQMKLKS